MAYVYHVAPLPADATIAERIAGSNDEPDVRDWEFRRPILRLLPDRFSIAIAEQYQTIHRQDGRRHANLYLLDVKDELGGYAIKLAHRDDEVIALAKRIADSFAELRLRFRDSKKAIETLCAIAYERYQVKPPLRASNGNSTDTVTVTVRGSDSESSPPVTVTVSVTGTLNRICNEYWWRRALRTLHIRNVEKYAIQSGFVSRYVSDELLHRYVKHQQRNKRILQNTIATNEEGQEFTLEALSELNVSNPRIRRAELMKRMRGFEDYAESQGHVGCFYTITCPSKMHAKSKGQLNKKYNGTTPRQAQAYLAKLWSQIRAKLDRNNLKIYGFRVAEPHQDGTPHWHLLLFMRSEHQTQVTAILREYAMREDGDEEGAAEHRFEDIPIDKSQGTATGYLAKYVSKNIDGYGVGEDESGDDAESTAVRVKAWASTWGIRQFQQIGGPPITLWREFRRMDGGGLEGLLKDVWEAANNGKGDWGKFVALLGGATVCRKDIPITIAKTWSDEPNRYEEPKGYQLYGVQYLNVIIPTRIHTWTMLYRPQKTKAEKGQPSRDEKLIEKDVRLRARSVS
jgi:hypothetical protein